MYVRVKLRHYIIDVKEWHIPVCFKDHLMLKDLISNWIHCEKQQLFLMFSLGCSCKICSSSTSVVIWHVGGKELKAISVWISGLTRVMLCSHLKRKHPTCFDLYCNVAVSNCTHGMQMWVQSMLWGHIHYSTVFWQTEMLWHYSCQSEFRGHNAS